MSAQAAFRRTAPVGFAGRNRLFILGLILFGTLGLWFFNNTSQADAPARLSAVFRPGTLEVTIPYLTSQKLGRGTLNIEILGPDNKVIASHSESDQLNAGEQGVWKAKLAIPATLQREDIVWHRLQYRFSSPQSTADAEPAGIHAISSILRFPVVRVLGQQQYGVGSPSAVRLVAVDGFDGSPLTQGTLELALKTEKTEFQLGKADLDTHGTVNLPLNFPAETVGKASLKINVDTPVGTQELVQPITLVRRESILITTDKPMYQPGQMIHLRALALDRFTRAAANNRQSIIEIEDAKGNKVFKRRTQTDAFGVAFADFQLADEVNMGAYKLRVILGAENDPNSVTQERTVTVDRYVLPKFKIEVNFDGDAQGQKRRYYAPGETVAGTITAKYLFGKPVSNGKVTLKLSTFDVSAVELGNLELQTDADGKAHFSSQLPSSFAGSSFTQGSAPVACEISVTDTANHTESKSEQLLVSSNPILILAVPESGKLVPNLENKVYILTSSPDGVPVSATVTAKGLTPGVIQTDANGFAVATVSAKAQAVELALEARDAGGKTGKATLSLSPETLTEDSLILRTDRTTYKVGETVAITGISTKQKGSLYLDIIKDRQTVLTTALEFENGKVEFPLDLSANLFGTLELRAYTFGRNADPISDRKLIFVDPADDLKVAVSTPKESFKPGESAVLNFTVTDAAGRPKRAVIGVEIVDEAVFALSEKQPGFEKIFFYLEQELLKPRYEIHSFSSDEIVPASLTEPVQMVRRETAAKVLLAAATEINPYTVKTDAGRDFLSAKQNEYASSYYQINYAQSTKLVEGLNRYFAEQHITRFELPGDLPKAVKARYVKQSDLLDPWGKPYQFGNQYSYNYGAQRYSYGYVQSFGHDGVQGGPTDFSLLYYLTRPASELKTGDGFNGKVKIETNANLRNGESFVVGKVTEPNSNSIAQASVIISRLNNKGQAKQIIRSMATDSSGTFTVYNLPAGTYRIEVRCAGYLGTATTFTLTNQQQAAIEARLADDTTSPLQISLNYPYGGGTTEVVTVARDRFPQKNKVMRRAKAGMEGQLADAVGGARPPMPAAAAQPANEALFKADGPADAKKEARFREDERASKDLDDGIAAGESGGGSGEEPRVRSYFPETLYTNPSLITDANGQAQLTVPMADSITTWRVTMTASTQRGQLGSGTGGVRVFQDFFVDLDLPVSLTQDDIVSVPVAVYNYLPTAQQIELKLKEDAWFVLVDDTPVKTLTVGPNEVTAVYYRVQAKKIGNQPLMVTAYLRGNTSSPGDAVSRTVEVIPNGEMQALVVNDRLEGNKQHTLTIPVGAIDDASKLMVKIYPGPLSQVVEGLDSLLRMPGGCFEQTSSTTYPNVLVMDYLKTTKKIAPEIQVKAEGFISLGYQRLVTFEVNGGGFSWFGEAPANKILTSYGLMEFYDMSKVHEVDPRLISRTQQWLASQQQPDGSFKPDTSFINEGATNQFNTDVVRITAYIGWALAYTGYQGEAIDKAKRYVESHTTGKEDAYTEAVIANFAADYKADKTWADRTVGNLVESATQQNDMMFWEVGGKTPTYASGDNAAIETTALATQAVIKWGRASDVARKALAYLTSKKDSFGNWQSTQATILSLKAFLLAQKAASSGDTRGTVEVVVNGQPVHRFTIDADNQDLMQQVDLKRWTQTSGAHQVDLRFSGQGSLLYQIVGRYYMPWAARKTSDGAGAEPLSIKVDYDRTRLAQDDIATAKVTVRNNQNLNAELVMVDLGIPPGFEPLAEDLQELMGMNAGQQGGHVTKFTITGKQVILYFDAFKARQTVSFNFRLKAKYPLKAKTVSSRVYEYYNPQKGGNAVPVEMVVTSK